MKKLRDYHRKRSPGLTNEPFGGERAPKREPGGSPTGTRAGAFVVHLHDATRRHYDLRLEVSGVLASFAVPKGPSLDPDEKGLAVKTEDHPIEYLEFEDVIPAGEYGGGPMITWDRGHVTYLEGSAEDGIARGKLDFVLRGLKLRGRFALVKLKKSEKGDEWLLFKKKDAHSDKARRIVEEMPRSVLSGLTVEELERREDLGANLVELARIEVAKLSAPEHASAPRLVVPDAGPPPRGRYLYDAALEGVRVLASRDGDVVTLQRWSARGAAERVEAFYPEIVRALRALPVPRLTLDGELVAFDESGRPSPRTLAERTTKIARGDVLSAMAESPVVLVASDVLTLGDVDVRALPIERRRALLAEALPPLGFLRASPPLEGDRAHVLATCRALDLPFVIGKPARAPYGAQWFRLETGAPSHTVPIEHRTASVVTVSNREKVFWPAEGLTKGDLCEYYEAIAPVILPHLAKRPVILVRYPDGIEGKSFYQWNVPPGMPPWVRTLSIEADDEPSRAKRGFLVEDAATLVYIANLGCIPLHILAARAPHLDRADFFTIDFDVKQSELVHAVTLAKTLRELLDAIGLPGFPKTSGQSGLHVLVPLGPGQTFDTAVALADLLGKLLVERHPDLATMERVVKKRGPKVYVDTGQTGTTRAIVAPYSVRAVPGARVSTPLHWDEVTKRLDPSRFSLRTVPARVQELGDPMQGLLAASPDVRGAVTKLTEIVRPA